MKFGASTREECYKIKIRGKFITSMIKIYENISWEIMGLPYYLLFSLRDEN